MPVKKITNWIRDYFYLAKGHSFMFHKPPQHYLGYISKNKSPIILIPGATTKWQFLKAIAIAVPFQGSQAAKLIPGKAARELRPEGEMIKKLHSQNSVNHKIVSIFGEFDNHVWPTESCRLKGAKNIQVDVWGHHKILFNKHVHNLVLDEIEKV